MRNIFTEHPHSIGETYFQHFYFAVIFGGKMIIGGLACVIHAVFPFLCKKTASNFLLTMTNDFIRRMPVMEDRVAKLGDVINEKMHCKMQHAAD